MRKNANNIKTFGGGGGGGGAPPPPRFMPFALLREQTQTDPRARPAPARGEPPLRGWAAPWRPCEASALQSVHNEASHGLGRAARPGPPQRKKKTPQRYRAARLRSTTMKKNDR
ncbi:unnamed protein product [Prorocentrum cordatum]|uniref:Uncharacterized protein n=1 Tax=Prorocentrum cordatum TaxID=2364126 RepID=A0ABN9PWJ9_9DINO|nr:unnamed protein product [Polarella glacialis]